MKNRKKLRLLVVVTVIFLVLGGLPRGARVRAEEQGKKSADVSAADEVNKEQLARLLAPIALYPDTLLAQMFMASTYPLEIVEAARYVKKNPKLTGDKLDEALKEKEWDPSVKAMCHFPTVLKQMDEHLEATTQLGDFFLADQKAVMDMVQTLRRKAREKGELKSTKEQKVETQGDTIIIQPADPEVVYVPSYSTTVVYGNWWYPSPPYVWYPPPPAYGFVAGVAVGAWASHWCHANWTRGEIDVDIDRNINVNRPGGGQPRDRAARGNRQAWKHDPSHRKGVAYRNRDVRRQYGQADRRARQRDLARGYGGGLDRQTRSQIQKQGLKSNGRFGQDSSSRKRSTAGSQGRTSRELGRTGSRDRTSRELGHTGNRDRSQARSPESGNRTRSARSQRSSRSSYSGSAFSRSSSARMASRNSMRGRSSRGGGRRR